VIAVANGLHVSSRLYSLFTSILHDIPAKWSNRSKTFWLELHLLHRRNRKNSGSKGAPSTSPLPIKSIYGRSPAYGFFESDSLLVICLWFSQKVPFSSFPPSNSFEMAVFFSLLRAIFLLCMASLSVLVSSISPPNVSYTCYPSFKSQ
jgi:hypothetical protein